MLMTSPETSSASCAASAGGNASPPIMTFFSGRSAALVRGNGLRVFVVFIVTSSIAAVGSELVSQLFVMDGKTPIAQVVANAGKEAGAEIKLVDYVRFQLGEGIEKKSEDFAAEVAAQLKK